MVLITQEKVFIVEHNIRSYRIDHSDRPSLGLTAIDFQELFHNQSPSNIVILCVIENFHLKGSVLTQWKVCTGLSVSYLDWIKMTLDFSMTEQAAENWS